MDESDGPPDEAGDFRIQPDDFGVRMSATSPEGQAYEVQSYNGYGAHGPVFLGTDGEAPKLVESLVRIFNRGLGKIQRRWSTGTFPIVGVFHVTEDDDLGRREAPETEVPRASPHVTLT